MLEYLKFNIGGMAGFTKVTIMVENGIINTFVEDLYYQLDAEHIQLDEEESREWLAALENVHIERWRSEYAPDEMICDGESWELEYKRADKRCRHISGNNAYPENWDEFIKVMDVIAPLIDPEQVERIDIRYNRKTKMPAPQRMTLPDEFVIWDYSEQLTIDRATEKLIIKQNFGIDCVVTKEYSIQDGICELLDTLEYYFDEPVTIAPLKEDAIATYELVVEYHRHEPFKLCGTYNRHGLPEYWNALMDEIEEFLSFYGGFGEMFSFAAFGKGVRPGEYIYCSVSLEQWGETYFYRTEDDTINVGDYVIVPVGASNNELRGLVEEIDYFTADCVPFPLEKTKIICRKTESPPGDEDED